MKKFTGFKPEHVGAEVTDIVKNEVGKIINYIHSDHWPVVVKFKNGKITYREDGCCYNLSQLRTLYFGQNIKVKVTGEEVPETRLICPVCQREHEVAFLGNIGSIRDSHTEYSFKVSDDRCPFACANFESKKQAETAMKNLIKFMEK